MKFLKDKSGSIIALSTGLILILLIATIGSLNISYLVGERFELQTELDSLALQLVQQVDYDQYFETGFSDALVFDIDQIDGLVSSALITGRLAACGSRIATAISGLTIDLVISCEVPMPFPLPGFNESVVMQIASSARLAQAAS